MKNQHPKIIKDEPTANTIVLVIGESMTRNYCSSYGYSLDSTPYLRHAVDTGDILRFTDVISPDQFTNYAIPMLLTLAEDRKDWIHATFLINIFKAAGFETYWFSNQEYVSMDYSKLFPALYSCCDHIHFTQYGNSFVDWPYDGELLPLLHEHLPKDKKKKFIIIHLIGSHSPYIKRYSKDFSFFSKQDVTNQFGGNQTIVEYLNSLRYNDFIIQQIINLFASQESIVLYLPDHGEEVFDVANYSGRGYVTHNTVQIPFYLWLSDSVINDLSGKKEELLQYLDRPYISSLLPHAIMDISGVQSDEYDPSKSIFNSKYQVVENRMVLGINYDLELKNKRVKIKGRTD